MFMQGFSKESKQLFNNLGRKRGIFILISLSILLFVWEGFSRWSQLPAFILPSPSQVGLRFWETLSSGTLLHHTLITLSEVLCGLLIGAILAAALGYFLAQKPAFEQILGPYIVASQAIPIVAIAPLLVIWFGSGMFSKILICSLIVFFPVLINTMVGLRSVPNGLYDLMRSLHATRWQIFYLLELPSAMPIFLGGLRIGAALSVIGAVVGEFVGADRGVGFIINIARGQYDTALVFVAVFVLIIMALTLYGIVLWLENHFLAWQRPQRP